jgi:hypothetical protein
MRRLIAVLGCLLLMGCSASVAELDENTAFETVSTDSAELVEATIPISPTFSVAQRAAATLTQIASALPSPTVTPIPEPTATATPKPTAAPTIVKSAENSTNTPAPTNTSTVVESTPTETPTDVPPPAVPASAEPPADISAPVVGPQAPSAYETSITIPTYAFENGFVPTNADDPIYPYPRLDFGQVGGAESKTYRAIVLENGYVSVTILPELGGRIYRWVDKATGRELLYQNPVIKPTNWGYRGWWLAAGGIEWAFPVEEHGLNEWRPWESAIGYSDHGLAVFVSNIDDHTGMEVGATISLDTEHSYVTIQPWARNDTEAAHPYQLWLNAMVAMNNNFVSGSTQLVVPAGQVTVHSTGDGGLPGSGGAMSWPNHGGRDMSWYSNWNGYLGFFVPTGSADYVGIYDHSLNQGIVRTLPQSGWPSGTKFFGPSTLSPSLWTDDSSNYLELWSGATPSFNTYWTLEPGQSVGWTEHWYPISGLNGFTYANPSAALRLVENGGSVDVGVAVTKQTTGTLALFANGTPVAQWPVSLLPGQQLQATWQRSAENNGAPGLRLTSTNGTILAQTGTTP